MTRGNRAYNDVVPELRFEEQEPVQTITVVPGVAVTDTLERQAMPPIQEVSKARFGEWRESDGSYRIPKLPFLLNAALYWILITFNLLLVLISSHTTYSPSGARVTPDGVPTRID